MAHTLGTLYPTEFAGAYKVVGVKVDAGTETGTVVIDGLTTIRSATATLAEAPTAQAALVAITGLAGNILTIKEYTSAGVLTTQTALDFYLTVVGEI